MYIEIIILEIPIKLKIISPPFVYNNIHHNIVSKKL